MGNFFSKGISIQNIELVLIIFNKNLAICSVISLDPTGIATPRYYPLMFLILSVTNT